MGEGSDLDEGEGGDGGEVRFFRIVKRSGRMGRIDVGDPEDSSGRNRLPVGGGEREAVVRSGVQRIGLQQEQQETEVLV